MRQYEVTFIVDPVLSGDEIEGTAKTYLDLLKGDNCEIIHKEDIGLRQLAYTIAKRTTGVYYCIEFTVGSGDVIRKLELALRRDERIMRFLTVALDKYGIKYNEDKRNGLIGKKKLEAEPAAAEASPSTVEQAAKTPPVVAAAADANPKTEEE